MTLPRAARRGCGHRQRSASSRRLDSALKSTSWEGKISLLSAHDLIHFEHTCDRVAILKDCRMVVVDAMEAIRSRLGSRHSEVVYDSGAELEFSKVNRNYLFGNADTGEIVAAPEAITERACALVNLYVQELTLEEIYVDLLAGQ